MFTYKLHSDNFKHECTLTSLTFTRSLRGLFSFYVLQFEFWYHFWSRLYCSCCSLKHKLHLILLNSTELWAFCVLNMQCDNIVVNHHSIHHICTNFMQFSFIKRMYIIHWWITGLCFESDFLTVFEWLLTVQCCAYWWLVWLTERKTSLSLTAWFKSCTVLSADQFWWWRPTLYGYTSYQFMNSYGFPDWRHSSFILLCF